MSTSLTSIIDHEALSDRDFVDRGNPSTGIGNTDSREAQTYRIHKPRRELRSNRPWSSPCKNP
jgi:hypothetical protein